MTRTQIRELTFTLLYSLEIQKNSKEEYNEQIELFLKEQNANNDKMKLYAVETVEGIAKNEANILELISKNLKEKWTIERISKINIVLLKLAIYEIIYSKIQYKIILNEVVELAKKYGDENSPSFVNGILANIIKQEGITNEE